LRALLTLTLCFAAAAAWADHILVGDPAMRIDMPYYGGGGYEAVRCMEVVRRTDGLVTGDITRWEWQAGEVDPVTGKFYKFKLRLCHTSRADLKAPFGGNYEGRTPVEVFAADPATVDMRIREWFGFDVKPAFKYDEKYNLLVEVWWEGDDEGGGLVFTADVPEQDRCVFASKKDGVPQYGYPDQGKVFNWLHFMRITLLPDAVAPTSLGRVKALYR
jgi:hypothetical protein